MTVVLIAVYIPIGFMGGLTGALFTEFAFTLVGAVTISGIVALTLSPMMCSRFSSPTTPIRRDGRRSSSSFSTASFDAFRKRYQRLLHGTLNTFPVTIVFALIVLGSIYFLYAGAKSELAPQEDQGVIITSSTAAPAPPSNSVSSIRGPSTRTSPNIRRPTMSSSSTCPARPSPGWCSSPGTSASRPPASCSRSSSRS